MRHYMINRGHKGWNYIAVFTNGDWWSFQSRSSRYYWARHRKGYYRPALLAYYVNVYFATDVARRVDEINRVYAAQGRESHVRPTT